MKRSRAFRLALSAVLFCVSGAASLQAQWTRPTSGVTGVVSSVVSESGAYALEANPGALALVPGWDVQAFHIDDGAPAEAIYGVRALPFRLSVAGGADWRRLPGRDSGRVSLGGAWAQSSTLSVGVALRYLDFAAGRSGAFDVGVSWRPSARLGIGVVLHDLFGPLGLTRGGGAVPGSAVLGAQIRPFESDALFLEMALAVDTNRQVGLRGLFGAHIPHIGRVGVVVEGEDVGGAGGMRVMASLRADWGAISAEGGVIRSTNEQFGALAALHLRSAVREGLPETGVVDDLYLRGGIGPRRLLALLERLDRDRFDARVRGVLLRFRSTGIGMAVAQEIRQAIAALEAVGKRTICHLDAPTGSEIYACGTAHARHLDPAGTVRMLGVSSTALHYGGALRRLGVRTDFIRIGEYKSAVEIYGSSTASPAALGARGAMLDDASARMRHDLAIDRDIELAEVGAWIDQGLFSAQEARDEGIVDVLTDEYELGSALRNDLGTSRRRENRPTPVPTTFARAPRVAVLVLDGSVVDGDNVDYPIIEIHQSGARTFIRTLEAVRADDSIKAVVLRIDSPGGSALAADQIWRAVRRLAERKPVIASMGSVAASAAYYIASACHTIYANPTTITGSIGVLFGKVDFAPLADMLGVGIVQQERGAHAGAESLYRPFSADERAIAADQVRQFYRLFLQRVALGRNMSVAAVHEVAQGRIWTGDAAQRLGLIDELGGFMSALHEARMRGGLDADAPFVSAPSRPGSLLEYVFGSSFSAEVGTTPQARGLVEIQDVETRRVGLDIAFAIAASADAPLAILPVQADIH
ncbi:MAG: protease-4 [Polyangiales bacterium]